ncbi:TPA: restriction endonuclease subunit S [Streptococcus suis]|nr:restriction endonuclease subunit S [Streptococcus suis]
MSEKFITANNYCREVFDGTHDTPKPSDYGYKLVTSKNIIGNTLDLNSAYLISQEDYLAINKRSKVSQFDVLFSMIGSVGNVYIEQRKNEEIDYSIKNIGVFSSKTEKEAYWLYYYLQSPYAQSFIKKFLNGAVQKFLPLQTLRAFPILSPVENYESIISILKNIDQKIALNNQINEELEAMAKTLYDYWFVQFDFPNENGKPYKSSGGKMVYNDQLKREIPEGWGVKQLGELDVATGKRDANFGTENGQYDFWTTANEPIKADEYSFEGKAILIAGNGNFYINFTEGKFEAYQRTYVIQSADENELLFMYPACLQSIEKLRKGSNGSIIKYITIGDVQNISQPHCPVVAKMFVDIFRPIMNTIQKNKQQNQELTQLRDWLLPMLMNGQVKVE